MGRRKTKQTFPLVISDLRVDGNLVFGRATSRTKEGIVYSVFYNLETNEGACRCDGSFYKENGICEHTKALLDAALSYIQETKHQQV